MTQNGKQPDPSPESDNLSLNNPQDQRLETVEILTLMKQVKKHLDQQNKKNPPAQQMALSPPALPPQLEADLQDLPMLLENLEKTLQRLIEGQEQILHQMTQIPESLQSQRQTMDSFITTANLFNQTLQTMQRQQQELAQQIGQQSDQQQRLETSMKQGLSQVQKEIPRFANRLNPIQVKLNGKELTIKSILIAFLATTLSVSLLSSVLIQVGLNGKFAPMLERMSGRLNNLEIQMKKSLKRPN